MRALGRIPVRHAATDAAVLQALQELTAGPSAHIRVRATVEQIAARAERSRKQVGLALFRLELHDKITVDRSPTGRALNYQVRAVPA